MEGVSKDSCIQSPSYTVLYSRTGSHSTENIQDSGSDLHSLVSTTLAEECRHAEYNKHLKRASHTMIRDTEDNGNDSDVTNCANLDEQSTCLQKMESTEKSIDKSKLAINVGFNPNNSINLNFMPVHSNQYVESQRKQFLKAFSFLTDSKVAGKSDHIHHRRPRFPYMPWDESILRPSLKKEALLSRFDKTFNPHVSESQSCENLLQTLNRDGIVSNVTHTDVSNEECSKLLIDFTHYLKDQSNVKRSIEAEHIRKDVETMIKSFLDNLQSKYKFFSGYELLKMGSTYEGTKIGKPDEFDFMVELPYLCEVLEFVENKIPTFTGAEMRNIRILNRSAFSDIYVPEVENESDDQFISKLWHILHNEMAEDLKTHLLDGWEWLNAIFGFRTLALTQTFLWNGKEFNKLVVDVDICLAVPLRNHNFRTCIDFNQEILDATRPGIGGSFARITDDNFTHVLIRSDGKARLTLAVREMMVWNHATNDKKKSLFRCLKRVVAKYLPGKYNEELYRLDAMIPSYWLKTILFYMFTHYVDEENWSDAQLPLRFLEAMLILEKCLKSKQLSSFFVPHNVIKRYSQDAEEITRHLNELVELLLLLQRGDITGLSALQKSEKEVRNINKDMLEKGLYSSLIDTCYIYAYNDYEHLAGLKSFVSVFLSDCVTIEGERNNMKVWYKGERIDIDAEIHKRYPEVIRYFWTDVQLSHVQCMVQRLRLRCPTLSIGMVTLEVDYSSIAFAKPL